MSISSQLTHCRHRRPRIRTCDNSKLSVSFFGILIFSYVMPYLIHFSKVRISVKINLAKDWVLKPRNFGPRLYGHESIKYWTGDSNLESEETVPYKPSPPPPSVAPPPPEGSDIGGGLGAAFPALLPHPQPAIGRPSGPTGQGASRPAKNINLQGDTSRCSLGSVDIK